MFSGTPPGREPGVVPGRIPGNSMPHFFLAARKKIQIHAYPDGGEACFFIYIVDFLWSILDCGFRSSHIIVQGICDFFLQLSPNMAVMPCKISNHEKTSLYSPVHFFNAFFAQKNRFLSKKCIEKVNRWI